MNKFVDVSKSFLTGGGILAAIAVFLLWPFAVFGDDGGSILGGQLIVVGFILTAYLLGADIRKRPSDPEAEHDWPWV